MNPPVACDHNGGVEAKGGSRAIRDPSPRFGNDQCSGGRIPRGEVELPESVEHSHGDMAEVKGSRPGPSDPLGSPGKPLEVVKVPQGGSIGLSIGKACA